MEVIRNSVRVIKKRPFIILYMGALILAYYIIDSYNPITSILAEMNTFFSDDISESIISLLQFIFDPGIFPLMAIMIAGLSVIGGIVWALAFAGYLNVVDNAVDNKPPVKGEYLQGFKGSFLRLAFISMRFLFFAFIFVLFMLVASVPAIIITKSASLARLDILFAAIFVDVLTAGIIFFGLMFVRIYMFFWLPAAYYHNKKTFTIGKRVSDNGFWSIVKSLILFDIIFVAFQYLFSKISIPFLVFVGNWAFETAFFTVLVIYVFTTFKKLLKKV